MFLGTHSPRLDDKGRLILPAKFREQLEAGVVVTRGQEDCLFLYPTAEFELLAGQLSKAPVTSQKERAFRRLLLSGAFDEVPDRQGRITIPPVLRAYAGLERDCAVIGSGHYIEIWNAAAWETYLAAHERPYSEQSAEGGAETT